MMISSNYLKPNVYRLKNNSNLAEQLFSRHLFAQINYLGFLSLVYKTTPISPKHENVVFRQLITNIQSQIEIFREKESLIAPVTVVNLQYLYQGINRQIFHLYWNNFKTVPMQEWMLALAPAGETRQFAEFKDTKMVTAPWNLVHSESGIYTYQVANLFRLYSHWDGDILGNRSLLTRNTSKLATQLFYQWLPAVKEAAVYAEVTGSNHQTPIRTIEHEDSIYGELLELKPIRTMWPEHRWKANWKNESVMNAFQYYLQSLGANNLPDQTIFYANVGNFLAVHQHNVRYLEPEVSHVPVIDNLNLNAGNTIATIRDFQESHLLQRSFDTIFSEDNTEMPLEQPVYSNQSGILAFDIDNNQVKITGHLSPVFWYEKKQENNRYFYKKYFNAFYQTNYNITQFSAGILEQQVSPLGLLFSGDDRKIIAKPSLDAMPMWWSKIISYHYRDNARIFGNKLEISGMTKVFSETKTQIFSGEVKHWRGPGYRLTGLNSISQIINQDLVYLYTNFVNSRGLLVSQFLKPEFRGFLPEYPEVPDARPSNIQNPTYIKTKVYDRNKTYEQNNISGQNGVNVQNDVYASHSDFYQNSVYNQNLINNRNDTYTLNRTYSQSGMYDQNATVPPSDVYVRNTADNVSQAYRKRSFNTIFSEDNAEIPSDQPAYSNLSGISAFDIDNNRVKITGHSSPIFWYEKKQDTNRYFYEKYFHTLYQTNYNITRFSAGIFEQQVALLGPLFSGDGRDIIAKPSLDAMPMWWSKIVSYHYRDNARVFGNKSDINGMAKVFSETKTQIFSREVKHWRGPGYHLTGLNSISQIINRDLVYLYTNFVNFRDLLVSQFLKPEFRGFLPENPEVPDARPGNFQNPTYIKTKDHDRTVIYEQNNILGQNGIDDQSNMNTVDRSYQPSQTSGQSEIDIQNDDYTVYNAYYQNSAYSLIDNQNDTYVLNSTYSQSGMYNQNATDPRSDVYVRNTAGNVSPAYRMNQIYSVGLWYNVSQTFGRQAVKWYWEKRFAGPWREINLDWAIKQPWFENRLVSGSVAAAISYLNRFPLVMAYPAGRGLAQFVRTYAEQGDGVAADIGIIPSGNLAGLNIIKMEANQTLITSIIPVKVALQPSLILELGFTKQKMGFEFWMPGQLMSRKGKDGVHWAEGAIQTGLFTAEDTVSIPESSVSKNMSQRGELTFVKSTEYFTRKIWELIYQRTWYESVTGAMDLLVSKSTLREEESVFLSKPDLVMEYQHDIPESEAPFIRLLNEDQPWITAAEITPVAADNDIEQKQAQETKPETIEGAAQFTASTATAQQSRLLARGTHKTAARDYFIRSTLHFQKSLQTVQAMTPQLTNISREPMDFKESEVIWPETFADLEVANPKRSESTDELTRVVWYKGMQGAGFPRGYHEMVLEFQKSKNVFSVNDEAYRDPERPVANIHIEKETTAGNIKQMEIDIDRITEQVYYQIEKKLKFERQRMGM